MILPGRGRGQSAIRDHKGYVGAFSSAQYPGALRNGTRVTKVAKDEGDTHPIGSKGQVLGSIGRPGVGVGYFIEWDAHPRTAVFVAPWKLAALG